MQSDYPFSILPIHYRTDLKTFGTGFVIHIEPAKESGQLWTFLLTCAHVVKKIDPENLRVLKVKAECVARGSEDDVDLAVLRVILPVFQQWASLRPLLCPGQTGTVYGCTYSIRERCSNGEFGVTPVRVDVTKCLTVLDYRDGKAVPLAQIAVHRDDRDRILPGFSGGPVVVDGEVRAVLDARADLIMHETKTGPDRTTRYEPGKLGTAIPIHRLKEIWSDMPVSIREQFERCEPQFHWVQRLFEYDSHVPREIAVRVFDEAAEQFPVWPGRPAGHSFLAFIQHLAAFDRIETEAGNYNPLGQYLNGVADQLADSATADKLREVSKDAGLQATRVSQPQPVRLVSESRQSLVIRIQRDPDESTVETRQAGQPLRIQAFRYQQERKPCDGPCDQPDCRSRPAPGRESLTCLQFGPIEASTVDLPEKLAELLPKLFEKFPGDKPDRVDYYLGREHASSLLDKKIDSVRIGLSYHPSDAEKEPLNAWTVICHHIDERLENPEERRKLKERLDRWRGTIKLKKLATSLEVLAKNTGRDYDSVVIGTERASRVRHHLNIKSSLICARFHSSKSFRNLPEAIRSPIPFLLLLRSDDAVATLNRLLKKTHCLRQLPDTLKEALVAEEAGADQIVVVADSPEYHCDFTRAVKEQPFLTGFDYV